MGHWQWRHIVDITHQSGDNLQTTFVSIGIGGTEVWNENGAQTGVTVAHSDCTVDKLRGGDRIRLKDDGAMTTGETLRVIWNNGDTSQVLKTSTVQKLPISPSFALSATDCVQVCIRGTAVRRTPCEEYFLD